MKVRYVGSDTKLRNLIGTVVASDPHNSQVRFDTHPDVHNIANCDLISEQTFNKICKHLIGQVESSMFRTDSDTGSNPHALTVLNGFRHIISLPMINKEEDLPKYDTTTKTYVTPQHSRLLSNDKVRLKAIDQKIKQLQDQRDTLNIAISELCALEEQLK